MTDYDVIVVGGRPAGAALTTWLGRAGWRVLVVDRTQIDDRPQVPSCPVLHMGTLAMLDELGVNDPMVEQVGARFDRYLLRFGRHFDVPVQVPVVHGRSWGYGIDRATFDPLLWNGLARLPSVERRAGFRFDGVLRDSKGGVCGVEGSARRGPRERITARIVVGADGRFSPFAKAVGAEKRDRNDRHASTAFFAEWEGVAPRVAGRPFEFEVHTNLAGSNHLLIPAPGGRAFVVTHERADRVVLDHDVEARYLQLVQTYPWFAERFVGARPVGRVTGLNRIENGYRDAAGPGWALVGDAFHYKDPIDGQGIYDALLCARILGCKLDLALSGRAPTSAALEAYSTEARTATLPMFQATLGRLATELYGPPMPAPVRLAFRWMLTDPAYGERLLRFIGRDPAVDPSRWRSPGFLLGALLRGAGRDLTRLFGRRAPPASDET